MSSDDAVKNLKDRYFMYVMACSTTEMFDGRMLGFAEDCMWSLRRIQGRLAARGCSMTQAELKSVLATGCLINSIATSKVQTIDWLQSEIDLIMTEEEIGQFSIDSLAS